MLISVDRKNYSLLFFSGLFVVFFCCCLLSLCSVEKRRHIP